MLTLVNEFNRAHFSDRGLGKFGKKSECSEESDVRSMKYWFGRFKDGLRST